MKIMPLRCGLTVLVAGPGGGVTSSGARVAIAEADGDTVIETAASVPDAMVRAGEIAHSRGHLCTAPLTDTEGRTDAAVLASLCRAPATTRRTVEGVEMALCAEHAAELDSETV